MRKLFVVSFIILLSSILFAQDKIKVLERQRKDKPTWITETSDNFIVGEGKGKSLESARNNARKNYLDELVMVVKKDKGVSPQAKTRDFKNDENVTNRANGLIDRIMYSDIEQAFSNTLPADEYWEKLKDKSTEAIDFVYYSKYPIESSVIEDFKSSFLQKFESFDRNLKNIEQQVLNVQSIEQISTLLSEIENLEKNKMNYKTNEIQFLKNKLKTILKDCRLEIISSSENKVVCGIKIENRFIESNLMPSIKTSDCLSFDKPERNDKLFIINYNCEQCVFESTPEITISLRLPDSRILEQSVKVCDKEAMPDIYLAENIVITGKKHSNRFNIEKISFSLKNKTNTQFFAQSVFVTWAEIGLSVKKICQSKAVYDFNIEVNQDFDYETIKKSPPFADIEVAYRYGASNIEHTKKIYAKTVTLIENQ